MSELQFPKDPIVGQEYDFAPYRYYWDGIKWKTKGIGYNPVNELRDELEPRIGTLEKNTEGLPAQSFEALRRSYAESGLNLVNGSFEEGGTLTSTSDVLLHKASGIAYSGPIGIIAAGTDPAAAGSGYTPHTDSLRSELTTDGDLLIRVKGGRTLRDKHKEMISVLDYGAVGDGVTDDTAAIQAAANEFRVIYLPAGYSFMMRGYVSLNQNQTVVIDGTVIQGHSATPEAAYYHIGGFDAQQKSGILICGSGTLSSEAFINVSDNDFKPNHYSSGYCPVIHLRACSNSRVEGLRFYKLAMGAASTIVDKPSQPDWNLVGIPSARGYEIDVVNCSFKYCNFFGVTLNTVTRGSLDGNYCYRCGDSGLHVQFCRNVRVINNTRVSPYGDGADYADGLSLLAVNDSQGISIESSHKSLVQGNVVIGFVSTGIDVKNNCTDILVQGNYIQDCQMSSIAVRGGDAVYGLNTAITVTGNLIKNTGYIHTSNPFFISHPYRGGIFVHDTYSCFIKGNTIVGHSYMYARAPITCRGVNLTDLGFWGGNTPSERIAYTKLEISDNTVTFPAVRSNYPDDPTRFLISNCVGAAILVLGDTDKNDGIWGDISITGNKLLGNAFHTAFSTSAQAGAIYVSPYGGNSVAGVASSVSIAIENNHISLWPTGGIFVDAESSAFADPTSVSVRGNMISKVSAFGIRVDNTDSPTISDNTIRGNGRVSGALSKVGIHLQNCYRAILRDNLIRKGATVTHSYAVNSVSSTYYAFNNVFETGTSGVYNGGTPASISGTEATGSNIAI